MSVDLLLVHIALRNRAASVSVATTGSTTLSATTSGYARAAGSFITDGFQVGMEVTPVGFTVNPVGILIGVTATALTTQTARAAQAAGAGRTISVGLPALRSYENDDFDPVSGRPYVAEDYVPATSTLFTGPAAGGYVEETGLYVLKWFGLADTGVAALRKSVDALRLLFSPGTTLTAGSHTVRIRGDTAPQTGQIIPLDGGWAVLVLTIPWRVYSNNLIAA